MQDTDTTDQAQEQAQAQAQAPPPCTPQDQHELILESYQGEHQLPIINALIEKQLSEPYIIYTYRYFVNQWPDLSFIAYAKHAQGSYPVGVIVSKLDRHLKGSRLMRGYIAMLSVRDEWRGRGIAKKLVKVSLEHMVQRQAQEVVLETEVDNTAALHLYESLGFIREKRLHRYYLNGNDSFRLVLPIPPQESSQRPPTPPARPQPPSTRPPLSDTAII